MRNIKLIALIFLTAGLADNLIAEKNDELKISGGTKISGPLVEGCFYKENENINWAGGFSSKLINSSFPVNVKAGNLGYSGIVSKLNNPMLSSSISPLGNYTLSTNEVSASFPNYTSFSNPVSYFLSAGCNKKKTGLFYLNSAVFCVPDERFGAGIHGKYKTGNQTFAYSQIIENSSYKENQPDSWFSKSLISKKDFYYQAGNHTHIINQFSYSTTKLSTIFTLGIYENLWGTFPAFVYKSENKINLKHSIINFSVFLNPNKEFILTSSEKKMENCFQTKLVYQKRLLLTFEKGGFMKIGCGMYFDSPVYYNFTSDFSQNIKNSAGLQIISATYRLTGVLQIDSEIIQQQKISGRFGEGVSFSLKSQWYMKKVQPDVTGSFTYKKNETNNTFSTSEKVVLSVSFLENPKILVNSSVKITQKNLIQDSIDLSASVSVRYSWNKFNFQLKAKN